MLYNTNTHTPFHDLCLLFTSFLLIFLLFRLHGHRKKEKETTPWLQKSWDFFLSLDSLRVFCYSLGQGSEGSKGGNLMQITLKGFITYEPATFLFSLKGRVRESISLATGRAMARKGKRRAREGEEQRGRKKCCTRGEVREREREKDCVSVDSTAEQGQITPEQQQLYSGKVAVCANIVDICALVHTCTHIHFCMCSWAMHSFTCTCVCMSACNKAPGGSKGLLLLYLDLWLMILHT